MLGTQRLVRLGFSWERGHVHPEALKEKMVENKSRKADLGYVEGFKCLNKKI